MCVDRAGCQQDVSTWRTLDFFKESTHGRELHTLPRELLRAPRVSRAQYLQSPVDDDPFLVYLVERLLTHTSLHTAVTVVE